uniref:Zinc finger protein OZF n=1 Tax=Maylandia zebra TaxID=106582 RepID=A0A3P9BUB1_9CICH|nr:zinc finger protein 501 isoform X2 [Maylandia zebra]
MNEVDYLDHNRAESLQFEEKPDIKPPDVEQLQDADINQTAVFPADVQQMLVIKEELPWTPSLDQQDIGHIHIKEEHEELWIDTGGAHLAVSTKCTLSSISMKCEDEREEKPQIVQLHQSQTEDNAEAEATNSSSATNINNEIDEKDCRGPEIAGNSNPNFHFQLNAVEKAPDSSETDISDGDDWQEPLSDAGPANEDGDSGCPIPKSNLKTLKSLKSKCSFQRRKTCHSFKRPYGCLANEKFNRVKQSEFSKMIVNTGEKTFTCGVCAKRFKQKQNLKTHMRVHTGDKPYNCDFCGKDFRHHYSFKVHIRIHTGEKPFVCGICGEKFRKKQNLKRHMRVHTGEKPFSCVVCAKRFTQQGVLKRHMRVHTREKPFGCNLCNKMFTQQGVLKRHMRVHTGEKPFSCGACGKKFVHQHDLKIHIRVHTGEKQFSCPACEKRFTQQGSLKRHMRVHTGEKPFGCNVCGKTFTQQGSLNRHTRSHTQ